MPANDFTMPLLITGGRVIDPAIGFDATADVLIAEGLIAAVGPRIADETPDNDLRVISADGLVVCPGFIDVHTHLREPGFEYKETIATGGHGGGSWWLHNPVRDAQYRTSD